MTGSAGPVPSPVPMPTIGIGSHLELMRSDLPDDTCDMCDSPDQLGNLVLFNATEPIMVISLCIHCIGEWAETISGWRVARAFRTWERQAEQAAAVRAMTGKSRYPKK